VDLIYLSKRADNGNAHSRAKPSFVAGAAGGCGSVGLEPDDCVALRWDDLVSRPIASTVSAGGCHGRRFAVPSDFVGCIACPRNNRACKRSMGSLWAWQDRHKIMPKCLSTRALSFHVANLPTCAERLASYRQNRARCIDTTTKRTRF
jgi:hypothetical protein